MESRWRDKDADNYRDSDLQMRVYTSRLLGQDADLVLHGGGNTSVKSRATDIFGEVRDTLYVKGSGWDLKTIEAPGFAPCDLARLQQLATLESLSDSEMMRQLRLSLLDPGAPTPSVEAILHAIIPCNYVDHTHTDAVVAVSNTPDGEKLLREIFADEVLILPYIMPGFVLARQVYGQTRELDWSAVKGIFLMHHGLFTFHDDARTSYENMIALVSRVEAMLAEKGIFDNQAQADYSVIADDLVQLAGMRQQVSRLAGRPMLAALDSSPPAAGFAGLDNVADIAGRGPVTPDHSIHTKLIPAVIDQDPEQALTTYASDYQAYFARHDNGSLTCLDTSPRFAVWRGRGLVSFAQNLKRLQVISDISSHTLKAIQWGEALGGWQALPEKDLFDVEYWELEQAKLKQGGTAAPLEGKVAVVSGAASGIGKACVEEFVAAGACVLALDINPDITTLFASAQVCGVICDVTDNDAIADSLARAITAFGGLDMVVSNAGCFTPSSMLADMPDDDWQASLALNLTAHMKLLRAAIPFLQRGLDPAVVIIASKNVPAPGPGAGAYSAAKAGLTQMARIAALELGADGIRVNVLHPNAVFDTGVWDEATLQQRAAHYGLSVADYKHNNVLGREVSSRDVAVLARIFASNETACTTGAQIPVDGGNERVI
jgi:rhamnose utilization protein RhaD (predicted bifunctional aldolase and dehydrogenase)/NAD(P)-dependent dehydrogenase (short-subunit alcohol dehydrogenase family)